MTAGQSAALLRLFEEIPALFHRLRAIAEDVHGREVRSAGRRGILRSLDRLGPQTVPQLARARPVSRQHIQVLAKGLIEDGLITSEENPAHRKSPLLGLTPKGKRELQAMQQREIELLTNAPLALPAKEIDHVTEALRLVRAFLDKQGME